MVFGVVMRDMSIALAIAMTAFGKQGFTIALAYVIQIQSAAWYVKLVDTIFGKPMEKADSTKAHVPDQALALNEENVQVRIGNPVKQILSTARKGNYDLVIIGGGVIGCELACVYATVGCKVTIVEALDGLLPNEDEWVGKLIAKELKKLGITSMVSQKVTAVDVAGGQAKVSLASGSVLDAEKVLVAVGRRAVCDKETVESLGLAMNGPAVAVNEKM